MKQRIGVAAVAIGLSLLTTSCTNKPEPGLGQPSASSSSSPASSGQQVLPYGGAPKVASPLPASVLTGSPCADAFTPAQVKEALGVEVAGKPDNLPGVGPKCSWSNPETSALIGVFYVTATGQGLSGVYENSKPQSVSWHELPSVNGFPGVAYQVSSGGDSKRSCTVSVGLADNLSIDVTVSLGRAKIGSVDPCSVTPRTAEAVVSTLKQKAGA